MTDPFHATSAMLAAQCAIEASAEMLRFHREGMHCVFPFGDPEPVAQLAEALLRITRIESALYPMEARINSPSQSAEYLCGLGQLASACVKFLDENCSITVLDVEDD